MTFDKLADRCMLFVGAEKSLLIELLKEAEQEMARQVNMYEINTTIAGVDGKFTLPDTFKSPIMVAYEGNPLKPMFEADIYYNSDNTRSTGTPIGYYIRNNVLFTNTVQDGSVEIVCSFYGHPTHDNDSPVIMEKFHRDLCDYAIAISSAREFPDLHNKHWGIWLNNLESIKNEDADSELIHEIRRVV